MTWLDVILYGPGWLACALAPALWLWERRLRRRSEQQRAFSIPGGGEITVTAPMTDAEYEAFRARWLHEYGRSQSAHPAVQLRPTGKEQPGA